MRRLLVVSLLALVVQTFSPGVPTDMVEVPRTPAVAPEVPEVPEAPEHREHMTNREIEQFMAEQGEPPQYTYQEPDHPRDSKEATHKCGPKTAHKCECCRMVDENGTIIEDSKCLEYCHTNHCHCGFCGH